MQDKRILGALVGSLLVGALGGEGDASASPSLRAQVVQHGDFVLLGNTLGQDCSTKTVAPVVGVVGPCPAGTTGNAGNAPDVYWEADFPAPGMATASTAIT